MTRSARPLGAMVCAILLAGCAGGPGAPLARHVLRGDGAMGPGISGHVIVEPRDGSRILIRALDTARTSIFAEVYILTSRSIVHALERAASQSVRVHVLLEHHPVGMGRQPETVASELQAAGVAVRWSDPSFALTHAKVMVIDSRLALISTANFSRAGLTADRDFMIWDRTPRDVYSVNSILRHDWNRSSGAVDAPNLVIAPSSARGKLESLVRGSEARLDVYGEEMRDPRLERVLANAACRGVAVRVIVPTAPETGSPIYRGGCVRVRVLTRPYVHAKVILVDGRRGFLGSENISPQSLDRNREIGVLVRGQAIRELSHVFDRDWKRGLPAHAGGS